MASSSSLPTARQRLPHRWKDQHGQVVKGQPLPPPRPASSSFPIGSGGTGTWGQLGRGACSFQNTRLSSAKGAHSDLQCFKKLQGDHPPLSHPRATEPAKETLRVGRRPSAGWAPRFRAQQPEGPLEADVRGGLPTPNPQGAPRTQGKAPVPAWAHEALALLRRPASTLAPGWPVEARGTGGSTGEPARGPHLPDLWAQTTRFGLNTCLPSAPATSARAMQRLPGDKPRDTNGLPWETRLHTGRPNPSWGELSASHVTPREEDPGGPRLLPQQATVSVSFRWSEC